jgi:ABC-type phosphate/phosphonate transport system permease subunit
MLKFILSTAFWSDVLSVIIAIVVGDLVVAWIRTSLRRRGWDFA